MWAVSAFLFLIAKMLIIAADGRGLGGQNLIGAQAAFVLMWPGFDLAAWRRQALQPMKLATRAAGNLIGGASLVWLIARQVPNQFVGTWLAMTGFVVVLHGGIFTALAACWRGRGRDVRPLMDGPLFAASVTEFWGSRWNTAFRDLAHRLIFRPLLSRSGKGAATLAVFLISGLVHELVVTVPAGGGYGGPTLYFLLQPLGMAIERGCPCAKRGIVWRLRTWLFVAAPLPLLFPTVFVERVMRPFFQFLHALP